MQLIHDQVVELSRQGVGMTEIAHRLGERRNLIAYIRARVGISERRGTTKPGDPERAERLLRALKEFWHRSELEWPEIAKCLGSDQPTLWGWFNGTRRPTNASLNKIERFLGTD